MATKVPHGGRIPQKGSKNGTKRFSPGLKTPRSDDICGR